MQQGSASPTVGSQDELLAVILRRFDRQERRLDRRLDALDSLEARIHNIESLLMAPHNQSPGTAPKSDQAPDHVLMVNPLVDMTTNSNVGAARASRAARKQARASSVAEVELQSTAPASRIANDTEEPQSVDFIVV